jgi:hypothetical protein
MIKASKMVLEIKIDLVCKDRKSTFLAQKKIKFLGRSITAEVKYRNVHQVCYINTGIFDIF